MCSSDLLNQNIVIIILTSCFRGKLLSVNLGTIPNDLVNWKSYLGPMTKGLSLPIISVATCPKTSTRQIKQDFHQEKVSKV